MSKVDSLSESIIPEEWQFDPIKGPFFRELLKNSRQVKTVVIGSGTTDATLVSRVTQNEADIDALEAFDAALPANIGARIAHRI